MQYASAPSRTKLFLWQWSILFLVVFGGCTTNSSASAWWEHPALWTGTVRYTETANIKNSLNPDGVTLTGTYTNTETFTITGAAHSTPEVIVLQGILTQNAHLAYSYQKTNKIPDLHCAISTTTYHDDARLTSTASIPGATFTIRADPKSSTQYQIAFDREVAMGMQHQLTGELMGDIVIHVGQGFGCGTGTQTTPLPVSTVAYPLPNQNPGDIAFSHITGEKPFPTGLHTQDDPQDVHLTDTVDDEQTWTPPGRLFHQMMAIPVAQTLAWNITYIVHP